MYDDWPLMQSPDFKQLWEQVAPYTMTSPARGYALWQAVNHVIDHGIPGSFVECGVWKGGSSLLIALTLLQRGHGNRDLFLFDTFAGMTAPTEFDKNLGDIGAQALMQGEQGEDVAELVKAEADLEGVKALLKSTGYDTRMLHFIEGDICVTAAKTQTLGICLLRLDTDFYDSTLVELEELLPRVHQGGPVIIDDYGHWKGAKKAVVDFFERPENIDHKPLLWALDYTGRGFIKQNPASSVDIEPYDYVPAGMIDPKLLRLFPTAKVTDPWTINWEYLRSFVPHIFRHDTRNNSGIPIGNASYEEAVCLHTLASQFSGKRGLEIGSHFAWTGSHLCAAGLVMDFVDPGLEDPNRVQAFRDVFDSIEQTQPYTLWGRYSPECIDEVRATKSEPWSFVFIDGDHDGDAPEKDAQAVIDHCAEEAIVMFHDMISPHVTRGLKYFKEAGWKVRLYNTMQVLGVAWRGDVDIPDHVRDPNVPHLFYAHLAEFL